MIKVFLSKSGGGKTLCAIAECAEQKGKKVAFISSEISEKEIIKRVGMFNPKCDKFTAFRLPPMVSPLSFYKKIESLAEDFDLICVDCPELIRNFDLQKLDDACFKKFMNQCQELWVTMWAQNTFGDLSVPTIGTMTIKKTEEQYDCVKIKQICTRVNHPLISDSFIEAVDLETKEIKNYNVSNLFKNKNL